MKRLKADCIIDSGTIEVIDCGSKRIISLQRNDAILLLEGLKNLPVLSTVMCEKEKERRLRWLKPSCTINCNV
jgi:hypothetical protein